MIDDITIVTDLPIFPKMPISHNFSLIIFRTGPEVNALTSLLVKIVSRVPLNCSHLVTCQGTLQEHIGKLDIVVLPLM